MVSFLYVADSCSHSTLMSHTHDMCRTEHVLDLGYMVDKLTRMLCLYRLLHVSH